MKGGMLNVESSMLNVESRPRRWRNLTQHSTLNIRHSTLSLIFSSLFLATTAFAQLSLGGASAIPQGDLVKLTGSIHRRTGNDVPGVVTATIESGRHINPHKPPDDFLLPTALSFDGTDPLPP